MSEHSAENDAGERVAADQFIAANLDEVRAVCEGLSATTEYEYGAIAFAYALGRTRVTPHVGGDA